MSSPQDSSSESAIPHPAVTDAAAPPPPEPVEPAPSDLPQAEELTPEILEDECRRGDAMLRWAALLLGILLSWTYLTDPAVLVQIRSGEYLLSHGILPPRIDVFSASATGRTWVNLGWMSDLFWGLTHKGGLYAVTFMQIVLAAVAFRALGRIGIPQVTTWWGSVCAVLAALALFPLLQPGQGIVTVLGLTAVLSLLTASRNPGGGGWHWKLPAVMWLWSNCDSRAFLGLIVIFMWTIGDTVFRKQSDSTSNTWTWKHLGLSLLAALIHPWHYHVLLAPYLKLAVVQPEVQIYRESSDMGLNWLAFSALQPEFWASADLFVNLGVVLCGLALLCQLLNRARLDVSLSLAWLALNVLGLFSGDLFAAAAVINAVVATWNGQDWFRQRFSQQFVIDRWSVLWAQAGRAITVLGMFGIAYLAINGALMGATGRRIGMGLDPRWRDRIDGLAALLPETYGDNVFPLRVDQGDLLIWLGKRPFVDSRLGLYAQGGENLLTKHREVRVALRMERPQLPGSGQPEVWLEALSKHDTFVVMPRLWGSPDYSTFYDLVQQNWQLMAVSGAGASFLPPLAETVSSDAALAEFRQAHAGVDFQRDGLRQPVKETVVDLSPQWPSPPTVYDRWLIRKLPRVNDGTQMALHFANLRSSTQTYLQVVLSEAANPQATNVEQLAQVAVEMFPRVLGLAQLSIRHARRGLELNAQEGEQPGQQAIAYRILRESYVGMADLEQILTAQQLGEPLPPALRLSQALAAAYHTFAASQETADLYALGQLQLRGQSLDLALLSFQEFQRRTGSLTLLAADDPGAIDQQAQMETTLEELEAHVKDVRTKLEEAMATEATQQQLLGMALEGGCHGMALRLLERDRTALADNLPLMLTYAELLMINGRTEEAWESLEGFERRFPGAIVPPQDLPNFQRWCYQCAVANAVALDLKRSTELLERSAAGQNNSLARGFMEMPLMAYSVPPQTDLGVPLLGTLVADMFLRRNGAWDQTMFDLARLQWEYGDAEAAAATLNELLNAHPDTPLRPLVAWMLVVITEKPVDPEAPFEKIPVTPDMFAPED